MPFPSGVLPRGREPVGKKKKLFYHSELFYSRTVTGCQPSRPDVMMRLGILALSFEVYDDT